MTGFVATAEIDIVATTSEVWDGLTDPAVIKEYMFGADVTSDWTVGSAITWSGDFNGTAYEDKGEIIAFDPNERLEVTHFSPLSGQEDAPENYHRVEYVLAARDGSTHLTLNQDGNTSQDEADHASENWTMMLGALKQAVEDRAART